MENNDTYQKVLDTLFLVRDKPNVFERLEDLFEHIIKPSVMLTLVEATAPGIAKRHGLGVHTAGRAGVIEDSKVLWGATGTRVKTVQPLADIGGVKPIIAVPPKTEVRTSSPITVYQDQASAFAGHYEPLLNVFV